MYPKSPFIKLIFIILSLAMAAACDRTGKEPGTHAADSVSVANSVKEISRQIEKESTNPELYYQRAVLYFNEQYFDRALSDIDQAISYSKQNALYYYFKGRIQYAMNQTLRSADAYEQAIKLKPDYTEAKLKVAELYYVVKEHQRSMRYLNSVLDAEPSNTTAHFFRGMNLKEMKDTAAAIEAFQAAFETDKSFYDAAMQLGLLYEKKNAKLAQEYYSAAIRMNPKVDEAYFARAVLYQENKMYKEALNDYRKVIAINPANDNAYYNVGYINFETKHLDEAIRNWNICIRMNNNYTRAYYMRGLAHEINGNKTEARLNYEYALRLEPEFELAKIALKRIGK